MMNKIILIIVSFFLIDLSTVNAANVLWVNEFNKTYNEGGIDKAVVVALKDGVVPVAIMEFGLYLEDLEAADLVKAMYCAGIRGNDIKLAAELFHVSESDVVSGYKKSFRECSERIVDTETYSPAAPVNYGGLEGPPDPGTGGGGGGRPASPSRF